MIAKLEWTQPDLVIAYLILLLHAKLYIHLTVITPYNAKTSFKNILHRAYSSQFDTRMAANNVV